jgi:hypothetical protein
VAKLQDSEALAASNPAIIKSVIGPNEQHLPNSKEHHLNWLESVKSRRQPIAPVEVAHRACSACLLHHMAMKLDRKLFWDPVKERFKNDDEANACCTPQRGAACDFVGLARSGSRGGFIDRRSRWSPQPCAQ